MKVPEDVTRDTVNFGKRILGAAAELGDLLSDRIRFQRYRSAIKTLNRAAQVAKADGVHPKQIPLKFLVPFLEECSLEDEESPLIEQWAALLVSAAEGFDPLHVAIKEVLKNISSKEAEIIQGLGTTIEQKLFDDNVNSHEIAERINDGVRNSLRYNLEQFITPLSETDINVLIGDLSQLHTILLFYHIPTTYRGVTKTVSTNFSEEGRGSIFLLERLEVLKSQEMRLPISDDLDVSELVISYAQLTAFGVEVYRECVAGKSIRR
jgi:hypothetical protein